MRYALLVLAAFVLSLGCDSPGLLANIDTYTCAWLPFIPGEIDCSDTAVHDKAVAVLTNGAVQARIECTFTTTGSWAHSPNPPGTPLGPSVFKYKQTRFADGSCFVQAGGNDTIYSKSEGKCGTVYTVPNNPLGSLGQGTDTGYLVFGDDPEVDVTTYDVTDGVPVLRYCDTGLNQFVTTSTYTPYCPGSEWCSTNCATAAIEETECSGFNLEAFGAE